jgi:hypothetical protein
MEFTLCNIFHWIYDIINNMLSTFVDMIAATHNLLSWVKRSVMIKHNRIRVCSEYVFKAFHSNIAITKLEEYTN